MSNARQNHDHLFYSATTGICSTCLLPVSAKEIIRDDQVFLRKRCPKHGLQEVLIAEDADYWRWGREVFLKAGEKVERANTGVQWGCPYDCGICPDHEQHGCLSILEVTDACNLTCPTCYAGSQPGLKHRDMATIEGMLDAIVANEAEPDVVQISGGEPTIHPDFFAILDACKQRPIRHLMLNTNGLRLAKDPAFVEKLASYCPGFEVYLQFDGLRPEITKTLRGQDLSEMRQQALNNLNVHNISTTLVATVRKGLNDFDLGAIIDEGVRWPCVRGVTFQPVQDAGRNLDDEAFANRLTVSGVRARISEQSQWFKKKDIVPVPCHPDVISMAYALRTGSGENAGLKALTGELDPAVLIAGARNTIAFERDVQQALAAGGEERAAWLQALSTNHSPLSAGEAIKKLLCCLPGFKVEQHFDYDRVFRVIIMGFQDRHSLDLRSVRKSCVHIAHPDGKRVIPFEPYNIFYRGSLEQRVLAPLREKIQAFYAPPAKADTASAATASSADSA